jgi:hypothetical protein
MGTYVGLVRTVASGSLLIVLAALLSPLNGDDKPTAKPKHTNRLRTMSRPGLLTRGLPRWRFGLVFLSY